MGRNGVEKAKAACKQREQGSGGGSGNARRKNGRNAQPAIAPQDAEALLKKPYDKIALLYEKRIRNLEKRKSKLTTYAEKQKRGETLSHEQIDALSKIDEVQQHVELLVGFQKNIQEHVENFEKTMKKEEKKRKDGKKQKADERRFELLLRYQEIAKAFQDPFVRKAFTDCDSDDEKLSEAEQSMLDGLRALLKTSPESDNELAEWNKIIDAALFNWVLIVTASDSRVVGNHTGSEIGELLERLSKSEKFERTLSLLKTTEGKGISVVDETKVDAQDGEPTELGICRGAPPVEQKPSGASAAANDLTPKIAQLILKERPEDVGDVVNGNAKPKEPDSRNGNEISVEVDVDASTTNDLTSSGCSTELMQIVNAAGKATDGSGLSPLSAASVPQTVEFANNGSSAISTSLEVHSDYVEYGNLGEEGAIEKECKEPNGDTETQKAAATKADGGVVQIPAHQSNGQTVVQKSTTENTAANRTEEGFVATATGTAAAGSSAGGGGGGGSGGGGGNRWRDNYRGDGSRRRNYHRFGPERGGGGRGGGYRNYGGRRRGDYNRLHHEQEQERQQVQQQPHHQQPPQQQQQQQQFYEDMRPYDPNEEQATAFSAFSVGGTVYFTPASPPLVYASPPPHYVEGPPAPFTQLPREQIPQGPPQLDYQFSGPYNQYPPYAPYE